MSDAQSYFEERLAVQLRRYAAVRAPVVEREAVARAVAAGVASRRSRRARLPQPWQIAAQLGLPTQRLAGRPITLARAGLVGVLVVAIAFGFAIWAGGDNGVLPPGGTPNASASPPPSLLPTATLQTASPPPPPASPSAVVVHGWPTTRQNAAGVYSWDGITCVRANCILGFMHNGYGSGDVTITIMASIETAFPQGATAVTVAGHDAVYRRINALEEEWIAHIDALTVTIRLSARPGVSQADLAEAHAIVDSMRYEPKGELFGFRLVFTLTTDDWDSG